MTGRRAATGRNRKTDRRRSTTTGGEDQVKDKDGLNDANMRTTTKTTARTTWLRIKDDDDFTQQSNSRNGR